MTFRDAVSHLLVSEGLLALAISLLDGGFAIYSPPLGGAGGEGPVLTPPILPHRRRGQKALDY